MRYILGVLIGGGAGYLFHKLVGCSTGTCPIVANPYASTIYGAIIGLILSGAHF